jgi:hypothetical protein
MTDQDAVAVASTYAAQSCRNFDTLRKPPDVDFEFRTSKWVVTFKPKEVSGPDQDCTVVVDDATGKVQVY